MPQIRFFSRKVEKTVEKAGKPAKQEVPGFVLAHNYDPAKHIPSEHYMSEKLDGIRAMWNGRDFVSRSGTVFAAPKFFKEKMPFYKAGKRVESTLKGDGAKLLDGELWCGRGCFQETVSIVRKKEPHEGWNKLMFAVFDTFQKDVVFEERKVFLEEKVQGFEECSSESSNSADCVLDWDFLKRKAALGAFAFIVPHEICLGKEHLEKRLEKIERIGGEGLMLTHPTGIRKNVRCSWLLKVKSFIDSEAIVTEYIPGKGKYFGMTGSLRCKSVSSDLEFHVGSGMNDNERMNPPKIGSQITVRYQSTTKSGAPRFPRFVGPRIDL